MSDSEQLASDLSLCEENLALIEASLAAANERIRELEAKYHAEYQAATTARSDATLYRKRVAEVEGMYGRKSDQLTAEREVSDKLEKALKRVVGDHNAPNDCYATGPLTGNLYEDLVSCPSCEAESLLAEVAHIRSQGVAAT